MRGQQGGKSVFCGYEDFVLALNRVLRAPKLYYIFYTLEEEGTGKSEKHNKQQHLRKLFVGFPLESVASVLKTRLIERVAVRKNKTYPRMNRSGDLASKTKL